MATITLYNQQGKEIGTMDAPASLFDVKVNVGLIHEAVEAFFSNTRMVLAHTKGKGEVRGGGKKPWKQKGTGRARHGSIRSPLWKGGGVTFGPTNDRNFTKKINKKAKQKALAMVLSEKLATNRFFAVDTLDIADAKTKTANALLKALPCAGKKTLVITTAGVPSVRRATANLATTQTINANSLNIVELLNSDCVVASKQAIDEMVAMYAK